MGWRKVKLQDGSYVEISTFPVVSNKLVDYKRYVYCDDSGNHLCVKDIGDNDQFPPCVGILLGINADHFYLGNPRNMFELRDTINPSDYSYKRMNVQDLRYKTGVSPKKMEKVNLLLKRGWRIIGKSDEIILERKKRKKNANS